ncbi:MAG: NUDIX domain-containing protein [SAR202 cluster bacterium]|nr:NUDIX domain-containing protein [SAR202 cluster bacterium]
MGQRDDTPRRRFVPDGRAAPKELVTSARAVVLKGDTVLVSTNKDDRHLLPGGRVEPGETYEETVRRELLEEAGVEVRPLRQVGIVHLHHTSPKPSNYKYIYPDFLWAVYHAEHVRDVPEAKVPDDYEISSELVPIASLVEKDFGDHEIAYLKAATGRS